MKYYIHHYLIITDNLYEMLQRHDVTIYYIIVILVTNYFHFTCVDWNFYKSI